MADRFEAMAAFVAVCDSPGFSAAARRLHVAPSVVTRLVAALEQRLGTRLLQRTTRSVRLTEAGERFLERARRILYDVEEAEAVAVEERSHPRGRLVVSAPLLFGRMHVGPLLTRLLARHPDLSAELMLSDRYVSLVEEGVDVAVRIGVLPDSGLIVRRVGETRRVFVATPDYLAAQGGAPVHPSELARFEVVSFTPLFGTAEWRFFGPDGEEVRVPVQARFASNGGDAAISHVLAGGGITPALSYQVAEHVRSGRLVRVLEAWTPGPSPIQVVYPGGRLVAGKVRAFLEFAEAMGRAWVFG